MDIAFVRFASRIVIKDTQFCFLNMTWKAIAIVVSKAHKEKDLATCSKVEFFWLKKIQNSIYFCKR